MEDKTAWTFERSYAAVLKLDGKKGHAESVITCGCYSRDSTIGFCPHGFTFFTLFYCYNLTRQDNGGLLVTNVLSTQLTMREFEKRRRHMHTNRT